MNIQAFYIDGNYETFSFPALDFRQGYMIDNQRLVMDDWKEQGIRVDRCFWPVPDEDVGSEGLIICEPTVIVTARQLDILLLLVVDGIAILKRDAFGELMMMTAEEDDQEALDDSIVADDEEESDE